MTMQPANWYVMADEKAREEVDEAVIDKLWKEGQTVAEAVEAFATPIMAVNMGIPISHDRGFHKSGFTDGWKASEQLELYRRFGEPKFVISNEEVEAWAAVWAAGESAFELPVYLIAMLTQSLLAYWRTQEPMAPVQPSMPVVLEEGQQPEQADVDEAGMVAAQYQQALVAYQQEYAEWAERMQRIAMGGVRPDDVLAPYWRGMYVEAVPWFEREMRRYVNLESAEAKREEAKLQSAMYGASDGVGLL